MKGIREAVSVAACAVAALGAACLLGVGPLLHAQNAAPPSQAVGQSVNPFAAFNGKHLLAYAVTASDCGWSSSPAGMDALRRLRSALRAAHGDDYARVTVAAVDIDEDVNHGIEFLGKVGGGSPGEAFDQVIVGGSWLNEQIVRLVWRDKATTALIPQVILVERDVDTRAYPHTITAGGDRVLATISGVKDIVAWLERGTPLPASSHRH